MRTDRVKLGQTAGGFLTTALVAACASAGGPGSSPCSSGLHPHERPLSEVVDSAALQSDLAADWSETRLAVAYVRPDSSGALGEVEAWAEGLAPEVRSGLEDVVASAVLPGYSFEEDVFLFLGDRAGPAVRRVGRLRACAPRILNEGRLEEALQRESRELGLDRPKTVVVYALVRADGSVAEVRVAESSGDPVVDLAAGRAIRAARFSPGATEGIALEVWARFPVHLRPARSPHDDETGTGSSAREG
ncbi:MAG: TonB family protein [Gemmatimonadota bacterium]|jgi:TonB family protein